ncbi:hypothetical protein X745_04670 [Mesorhizobium sp. LNJC374B00]|nr:hypothetical protein X745_04670 [Mesorhizobium sp. LNJC374B00]
MNRVGAIALIAAGLVPSHASAAQGGLTTQELLNNCNASPGSSAVSLCIGYVSGVADTMMQVRGSDADLVGSCPSQNPTPTYGAYRQVFKNWAEKHPEKWGEPMFHGVRDALREMWPCQ